MQNAGFEISDSGTNLANIQSHTNPHLTAPNTSSGSVSPSVCEGKGEGPPNEYISMIPLILDDY